MRELAIPPFQRLHVVSPQQRRLVDPSLDSFAHEILDLGEQERVHAAGHDRTATK